MLKGLIGGLARGIGKMGGEAMEAAPRAAEKLASAPVSLIEKPPVSPQLMSNVSRMESKVQNGKPGAARNGLQEISEGKLKENVSPDNAINEPEQDLSRREFTDPLSGLAATPPPMSRPGEGFNVVSKTLEEIPEAIGGSPKDVVAESPQGR